MHKRFLRIDLEYDMDINPLRLYSYVILDSIKQILREDMPSVQYIFSKDSPTREGLDERAK